MRYLATGAGGFIGNYLFRQLEKNIKPGDIVVGIDRKSPKTYDNHPQTEFSFKKDVAYSFKCYCELESDLWVNRLISSYKPDIILHFAGCATVSSPAKKIWQSNVDTTFNLLESISKFKYENPPKFILASSILSNWNHSTYAASKIAAESLVSSYNYQGYIIGTSLRLCAVAGAGNTHGAVRDIVRKFMREESVQLLGEYPGSKKPYLFIEQLCNIILDILNNLNQSNCLRYPYITICPHDNVSIREIADIVIQYTKSLKKVEFNGETWKGDMNYIPNTTDNTLSKFSKIKLMSSHEAVDESIAHILGKDYPV